MDKLLVIGYGNPDREDDGVAWYVLHALANHFQVPVLSPGDVEPDNQDSFPYPHLIFSLQLMPEMAEMFTRYQAVCFVDAHTGIYEEELRIAPLEPGYQTSPFTHHLTPETSLLLAKMLYGQAPQGLMVSVRGYSFGYKTELTPTTAALSQTAITHIIQWLTQPHTAVDLSLSYANQSKER